MARLYNCGFEFNTNTSGMEWTTSSGGFVVQSTVKRSGGYAGRANPTASTRYMQHRFQTDAINTTYHRFYMRIATAPASTIEVWSYQDATTKAFSLNVTNGRVLEMVNPIFDATVLASSSALALDTWYRVEIKIVDHATTSAEFELKIDGTVVSSKTGLTGVAGGGMFNLGAVTGATSPDIFFDDIAINDTSGSAQTGYPGSGRLVLALPTGAGDNAATTGIYSYINEIPPTNTATSGSTMIELDANPTIGDYAMTDSSTLGIASTDTITLTQVMARIREEAAGTSNYTLRIKSAASATVSSSASVDAGNATARTNPTGTTAFTNLRIDYTDPTTGIAWTPTGTNSIDNMQAGVATTDGTPDIWCLFLAVYIEYQSPPTTALNTPADSATGQSTTPTLNFTGTDLDSDVVEYQAQVSTSLFDAVDAISNSGEKIAVSSATWSHTCGGTNRILVVGVNARGLIANTNTTVTGVTYNGVALTKIRHDSVDSGDTYRGRSELWYLIAPATGANDIVVTWTGSIDYACNGAISLTGIIQSASAIDANNGATANTDTTPSVNVTAVANNCYLIDSLYSRSLATVNSSQTTIFKVDTNSAGDTAGMSYKLLSATGSATMAWTSGAEETNISAVTIAPIIPVVNALSASDAGFTAGHPFASGAAKDYTVQSALSNSTVYYWRVRAIDPLGGNTYGAWASTRSFTTAAGGGGSGPSLALQGMINGRGLIPSFKEF